MFDSLIIYWPWIIIIIKLDAFLVHMQTLVQDEIIGGGGIYMYVCKAQVLLRFNSRWTRHSQSDQTDRASISMTKGSVN